MARKNLEGSITIEASLALPIFICGYLLIISLISIIRIESTVQYAVNQSAKEISQYCYVADRLASTSVIDCSDSSLNDIITSVINFSGIMQDESADVDDPETGSVIKSLTMMVSNPAANEMIGSKITDSLCRRLVRGYITENKSEADKYLMKLGGITMDDIDFRYSDILKDGRSVNITAIYNVRLNTFGLLGDKGFTFTLKNSAHTAAWTGEAIKTRADKKEESRWQLGNFERGRSWLSAIKDENKDAAVASGTGIDLYDKSTNTFTQVYSINIFSQSYSSYEKTSDKTGVMCYTLKDDYCLKIIEKYARKLNQNIKGLEKSITMDSGTAYPLSDKKRKGNLLIIVPEEAQENDSIKESLEQIAESVNKNTGIEVEFIYREKAL